MSKAARPATNNRVQRRTIQDILVSGVTKSAPYMKSSSNTNGKARAKAKGHPTMPPEAKIRVAARVRRLFCELVGINA